MDLFKEAAKLTPIQKGKGCYYKRDDLFTPFDDSPINGSKLRMCIWLMNNLARDARRVVSAASVKSPQLPMVTRVGMAFGKEVHLFIGSSNMAKADRNPMVKLAMDYGAEMHQSKCGFNSALQHAGKAFVEEGDFFLEYGISTTDEALWKEFYTFGGSQTKNIPEDITKITITAGSCNSVLSVLVGLHNQGRLHDHVYNLIGVGPIKLKLVQERFEHITGEPLPMNLIDYHNIWISGDKGVTADITSGGLAFTYDKRVKCTYDGIEFHPNYEAKMITWLQAQRPDLLDDETNLIWIVGSEPKIL